MCCVFTVEDVIQKNITITLSKHYRFSVDLNLFVHAFQCSCCLMLHTVAKIIACFVDKFCFAAAFHLLLDTNVNGNFCLFVVILVLWPYYTVLSYENTTAWIFRLYMDI